MTMTDADHTCRYRDEARIRELEEMCDKTESDLMAEATMRNRVEARIAALTEALREADSALFATHVLMGAVKGHLRESQPDSYWAMNDRFYKNLPVMSKVRALLDGER